METFLHYLILKHLYNESKGSSDAAISYAGDII